MKIEWPAPEIGEHGGRILAQVVERLKGIPYVVGFGTALGIHREGRPVLSDSDIDICITEDARGTVEEALSDWPLPKVRKNSRGKIYQYLYYPERLIVDVMVWSRSEDGWRWTRFAMPPHAFDPEWRDTDYGIVPLPGGVEGILEDLYGEWWIPKYRKKP